MTIGVAWDAILSSVPSVPDAPAPAGIKPGTDELRRYVGSYEFYGGSKLSISVEGENLAATFEGRGRIYFDAGRKYQITPAQNGLFILESPARDVLRFDESDGAVTGLTMNPGPWPISAKLRR